MPEEIISILFSALGIIVTGIVTFLVKKLTDWIGQKINDTKASNYLCTLTQLVSTSVCEVYQTYVETLKDEGDFDKDAQAKALKLCVDKIKSKLAPDIISYVVDNFGDIDGYLVSLIESTIYSLKRH